MEAHPTRIFQSTIMKPLSSTILIVPSTDDGVAFIRNQRIPHTLVVVGQSPINYDSLGRNEPTIFVVDVEDIWWLGLSPPPFGVSTVIPAVFTLNIPQHVQRTFSTKLYLPHFGLIGTTPIISLVISSSTRQLELAPPAPTEPASELTLKGRSPHRFMEELEDEAGFRRIQATWKQEAGQACLAVQVYAARLHRWLSTQAKLNLPANYECILARALATLARENGLIKLDDFTEYQLFHYAKWDSQWITISNSVIPTFPLNPEGRYRPPSPASSESSSIVIMDDDISDSE